MIKDLEMEVILDYMGELKYFKDFRRELGKQEIHS